MSGSEGKSSKYSFEFPEGSLQPKWGKHQSKQKVSDKIESAIAMLESMPVFDDDSPNAIGDDTSIIKDDSSNVMMDVSCSSLYSSISGVSSKIEFDRVIIAAEEEDEKQQNSDQALYDKIGGPLSTKVHKLQDCFIEDTTEKRGYITDFKGEKNEMTEKLLAEVNERNLKSVILKRAPSDYYQRPIEYRRDVLGAPNINYLCKSLLMKNTKAHKSVNKWEDPYNSLYYLVIFQYTRKLHAEKLMKRAREFNQFKLGKRQYKFRLAPADENEEVTGFSYNAVSPLGLRNRGVPIILSHHVYNDFGHFWLGGGETDLKMAVDTHEFCNVFRPFIVDITYDEMIDPNQALED